MTLGGSIFLIALDAILAFAVDFEISGLQINVIGYILMLAGVVGLILSLFMRSNRRRVVEESPRRVVEEPPRRRVVEERDPDVRREI